MIKNVPYPNLDTLKTLIRLWLYPSIQSTSILSRGWIRKKTFQRSQEDETKSIVELVSSRGLSDDPIALHIFGHSRELQQRGSRFVLLNLLMVIQLQTLHSYPSEKWLLVQKWSNVTQKQSFRFLSLNLCTIRKTVLRHGHPQTFFQGRVKIFQGGGARTYF